MLTGHGDCSVDGVLVALRAHDGRAATATTDLTGTQDAVLPNAVLEAALRAALEQIPPPAFVISANGRILVSNAAGKRALDRAPAATQAALVQCMKPRRATVPGEFVVQRLRCASTRPHFLAVARSAGRDVVQMANRAKAFWSLTPRQAEVMTLLARGLSNRVIAADLGCSIGTIELHVSAILDKAGAESRAELIARFWQELG